MGPDRIHAAVRRCALVGAIGVLAVGCGSPGSSASAAPPTGTAPSGSGVPIETAATSAPGPTATNVSIGDSIELAVGDAATVEGTGVAFRLLAASGPEAGCNDCPNHINLQVTCAPDSATLDYAFSGGMPEAALERARKQSACGLQFYVVKVMEGSARIRVDPIG